MTRHRTTLAAAAFTAFSTVATAQELSSSLYVTGRDVLPDPFADDVNIPLPAGRQTDTRRLNPAIAAASFMAVEAPEPRVFAVHDLVTIVIREDMRTDFRSSLETEKKSDYTGEISDFPSLKDLLDGQVRPTQFTNGFVRVGIGYESEFEGEGDYSNRQSMTARIQARVIDVKPNGTLVIEARKSVTSDHEHYTLVATGTCRVDDITVDNTILSSQLADLFIDKQHRGTLKRASEKGLFTNLLDAIFNF